MIPTPADPVGTLVFFLAVFAVVGVFFLFIHLVMGSFIRPRVPDAEKLTIYECGEPAVGSAWIQFDLRFYVVALLFVIFDVEVAFFFPWATVFGKANQLANMPAVPRAVMVDDGKKVPLTETEIAAAAAIETERKRLSEQLLPSGYAKMSSEKKTNLGLARGKESEIVPIEPEAAAVFAQIAFWDTVVFFGVLMVGFAYVWRRGDIDWVRAYHHHQEPTAEKEKPLEQAKVSA
jgi:NADH-quinone oxidoreductase subunit A